MFANPNPLLFFVCLAILVAFSCACGTCVVLIGWIGMRAGRVLSWMVLTCGLLLLVAAIVWLPRYWWLSMPPLLLGIMGIRIWSHQPATGTISLGSLLLTMGVVAVICAGIAQRFRHRQLERSIVAKIEPLIDCDFEYDFDGLATGLVVYKVPTESLEQLLSYLRQLKYVRRLQLGHCSLSLEQAKQIGDLQLLEQLCMQQVNLDDEKLREIGRLKNLESLDVMDNPITGQGLQHLWNANRLRHFWQNSDAVTPEDIELLRAKLPKLETS